MRIIHRLAPGRRSVGSVPGRTPRTPDTGCSAQASPHGAPRHPLRTAWEAGVWGVGQTGGTETPPPPAVSGRRWWRGRTWQALGLGHTSWPPTPIHGAWAVGPPPPPPPWGTGPSRPPCQTPCPDWQEHTASGAAFISLWALGGPCPLQWGHRRPWTGRARGPSSSPRAHRPDSWLSRGLRGPAWASSRAVPWDEGQLPQVLRGRLLGSWSLCFAAPGPLPPRRALRESRQVAPEHSPLPATGPEGSVNPGEGPGLPQLCFRRRRLPPTCQDL